MYPLPELGEHHTDTAGPKPSKRSSGVMSGACQFLERLDAELVVDAVGEVGPMPGTLSAALGVGVPRRRSSNPSARSRRARRWRARARADTWQLADDRFPRRRDWRSGMTDAHDLALGDSAVRKGSAPGREQRATASSASAIFSFEAIRVASWVMMMQASQVSCIPA